MSADSLPRRIWRARQLYLFISPFFILFAVFQFFPLLWSLYLSFHEWNGLGDPEPVGIANYRALLRDQMFQEALRNTVFYWLANLLLIIPLALLIASLLYNPWLKGRRAFRTILFVPYVTAAVAVGLIFKMLFDFNAGLINVGVTALGFEPVPWLTSTELSKLPVVALNVWRVTPWFTLILFSGMLGINPELYEAATVDGANAWNRFRHITIPSLGPILFFCFVTLSIDSFRLFTEPYILTGGGPGSSSLSIVQYLYVNAFTLFKFGMASAIGYVLTAILLLVSAAQIFALRRQSGLGEVG